MPECKMLPWIEVPPSGKERFILAAQGFVEYCQCDELLVSTQHPDDVFPFVHEWWRNHISDFPIRIVPIFKIRKTDFDGLDDTEGWEKWREYVAQWTPAFETEDYGFDFEQFWNGHLYDLPINELMQKSRGIYNGLRMVINSGTCIHYPGLYSGDPETRQKQEWMCMLASWAAKGNIRHLWYQWSEYRAHDEGHSNDAIRFGREFGISPPIPWVWCTANDNPNWPDRYWELREVGAVMARLGRLGFPEAIVMPGWHRLVDDATGKISGEVIAGSIQRFKE